MPLHMILPKPEKIAPRLAIGQPFQPATMPAIPESVTAVGDQTGKAYFKMGDNPNGPETVQVTPPRAPVSMAGGGVVTIGNMVLKTPGENEDPLVNQANFLSSMDNAKYGALGVQAPPRPAFQSSSDEMLQNLRFNQATQDVYTRSVEQRQQAEAQSARVSAPARTAPPAAKINPNAALEAQLQDRKVEEEKQSLQGKVPYQDPTTGKVSYMTPAQAAIRKYKDNEALKEQITGVPAGYEKYTDPWDPSKSSIMTEAEASIQKAKDNARISSAASGQYVDPETGAVTQLTPAQAAIARAQEQKRIAQAVSGVPEGMEKYTDPFTGKQSVLTPHDASLQKLKDSAAIKKEYEATLGPLGQLSEPQIIKELANLKTSAGPETAAKIQVFRDELASRGWFPEAIDIAVGQSSGGGITLGNIPGAAK